MTELVSRQHEVTRVWEVEGRVCLELRAVYDEKSDGIGPLYLLTEEGQWHRFYLDAGLLFWREGEAPDSEDDLLYDKVYISLADELRVKGNKIRRVEMDNSELCVLFDNGARLRIFCGVQSEVPVIRERSPA